MQDFETRCVGHGTGECVDSCARVENKKMTHGILEI
jgi:hypothetical protein